MTGYFITSTDTNVGKTTAAQCLMELLKTSGKSVACMKPVSAGCKATPVGLRNDDAIQLIKTSSIELDYDQVNPYAFEPPIAPHIAAQQRGTIIDLKTISENYKNIEDNADIVIVEGAGGWLVPVNDSQTMADVAKVLGLPVILVVGLRLGCINHALLTVRSITESSLPFAGWIANHVDQELLQREENIQALVNRIQAPLIGRIAYSNKIDGRHIELSSGIKL